MARSSSSGTTWWAPSTRWACRPICTTRASRISPTSSDSEKSWGHRFTASSPATTATTSSSISSRPTSSVSVASSWSNRASRACWRRSSAPIARSKPVVFLAWAPHPMNTHFNVRYLTGGDDVFGPNFGAATVSTRGAQGLPRAMPEPGPPAAEPRVLGRHRERMDGPDPDGQGAHGRSRRAVAGRQAAGARAMAGRRADVRRAGPRCRPWTSPPRSASSTPSKPGSRPTRFRSATRQPTFVEYTKRHARGLFDGIASVLTGATNVVAKILNGVPALVLIALIAGTRLGAAPLRRAGDLRRAGAAVHHEPGLLGRDAGNPDAGAGRRAGRRR